MQTPDKFKVIIIIISSSSSSSVALLRGTRCIDLSLCSLFWHVHFVSACVDYAQEFLDSSCIFTFCTFVVLFQGLRLSPLVLLIAVQRFSDLSPTFVVAVDLDLCCLSALSLWESDYIFFPCRYFHMHSGWPMM